MGRKDLNIPMRQSGGLSPARARPGRSIIFSPGGENGDKSLCPCPSGPPAFRFFRANRFFKRSALFYSIGKDLSFRPMFFLRHQAEKLIPVRPRRVSRVGFEYPNKMALRTERQDGGDLGKGIF